MTASEIDRAVQEWPDEDDSLQEPRGTESDRLQS